MMTVAELVAQLMTLPQDAEVEGNFTITKTSTFSVTKYGRVEGPLLRPDPEPYTGRWFDPDDLRSDFYEVRVTTSMDLTDEQAEVMEHAIAYSFKKNLRGEQMGPLERVQGNRWTFYYDITKSRSDDWMQHLDDAIEDARQFTICGTPFRKSDHKQAVEGLLSLHSLPEVLVANLSIDFAFR